MPNKTNRIAFRLYDFVRVKMEQQKKKWKITLVNQLEGQEQTTKKLKPAETKILINYIFENISHRHDNSTKQMEKIINLIKNHAYL